MEARDRQTPDDITRPESHKACRRLCFARIFDNHDVNYDFVNDTIGDRYSITFAKKMLTM